MELGVRVLDGVKSRICTSEENLVTWEVSMLGGYLVHGCLQGGHIVDGRYYTLAILWCIEKGWKYYSLLEVAGLD